MKIKKAVCALLSAVLVSSSLGTFAQDAQNDEFDESNIVLRFGVLSDIHLSGSWNTAGNSKLDKAYKTLLELAEKDNNGKSKLDAVFIDGDITDALNSSGNISSSMQKLKQNYIELAAFRDNAVNNFNAANGAEHVAVIYAAGNHDTSGGTALDENKQADSTGFYSAKLMQKIFSGYTWTNSVPGKDSPTDAEIAEYNKTLLTEYNEKEGLYYDFFYGNDLNFGSLGLDYGNRHAEINGYHFITVEPQNYDVTYSEETLDWLDGLLCEITEENPDKAVFVATHPRIKGTIFASVDQVSEQLTPILSKYPQVFIWGGHNHSPLNRETAIWQGGKGTFTALDAGVVQYATSSHFSYEGNKNPDNGKNFGGYSGTEYRKFSQGNYVEVDADGNVRVHRIDFYNSDLDAGVIKEIGTPWTVTGISADGSHLDKYTLDTRKNTNTAPYFDTSAKLSATATEEGLLSISFPAAKDDLKIISYFASVDKADGTNVAKSELTSFYYDHADEKELENLTYDYTFTQEMPTNCELTVSVYAVDDFGAQSSSLTAKTTIVDESSLAFPAKEFNLSNLNKNGWSSNSQGSLTHGVTFEGRTASEIKKISTNTKNPLIMNHWSTPFNGIDTNPYLVVDYYYQHDENSTYAPAPKMRWRFYIKAQSGKQLTFEANLKTNKWATAVIPLKNYIESFAADGYYGKQYKFDPWGTTALTSIDDNDKLYISGIRLVHDDPTVFTENGKAYVSSDSYIKGVSAKVYPTIAEGFAALGTSGGTVYVQGDIIADEGTHIEASGSERAPVTVQGFGKTLSEQQANRIWFRATKVGREIPYNGDTTFDKITLKAPTDEAGIFSKGKKLIFGKDLVTENTVKNSTEIDAAGSKSIAFNFGTTYQLTGNNIIEIHGGNITDVATVYQWVNYSGTANASVNSHFSFYGGNIENVTSGPRNSSTAVFDVKGNVNYDFYGGNFINVYTGIYKRGTVNGNIIYNVYGGNFANGIKFSNMYNSGGNSTLGNTAVIVHSKGKDGYSVTSPITLSSDPEKPVAKLNDTTKFVAVINNAELDKANFDSGLVADYKLRVYGGSAQPVFENGTLAGFSLCADNNAFVPAVNGVILESGQNGLYTLPEGETSIHFAINANTEYKENDTPEQLAGKLVVHGAQIRKADSALRFVATIGKDILDAMEDFDSDNTVCQKEKITGYGFAVIPENYIAPGVEPCIGMDKVRTVPAVNKYDTSNSNYICYTVCITGISCENASLNYVVRPYFTYEDSTGQTVTIYGKTYATSISAVSEMAIAADDKALK